MPLKPPACRTMRSAGAAIAGLRRRAGRSGLAVGEYRLAGRRPFCMAKAIAGISRSASLLASACAPPSAGFFAAGLASPQMHLLSGATMLGTFFILTDPVTASTTNRGRLIFRALAWPAGLAHPQLRWLSGRRGVCRSAGEYYRAADRLLHAPAYTSHR